MSKQQQHIDRAHERAREWFVNHRAEIVLAAANADNSGTMTIIEWKAPGTSNYAMRFLIYHNYVVVLGDVGEAVYGWGQALSLELLKTFDWHYFVGKCCASETGRAYTMKIPGVPGLVPNVRAIGHYVGLQMAIAQLLP